MKTNYPSSLGKNSKITQVRFENMLVVECERLFHKNLTVVHSVRGIESISGCPNMIVMCSIKAAPFSSPLN